jgi:hypothetical protein
MVNLAIVVLLYVDTCPMHHAVYPEAAVMEALLV